MLDKSIDGALLALRKQIIRESGEGLAHVEALCLMRGVDMPAVLPARRADVARKGMMRLIILDGIRKGYSTQRDLAAYVETLPALGCANSPRDISGQKMQGIRSLHLLSGNIPGESPVRAAGAAPPARHS
ncbi:MAG TPA: hypothetical protein GX700_12795 [Paracoccus sp.]|nr:hypothetical protein [Paracoccus sp. (in: a-proteobacteria)]